MTAVLVVALLLVVIANQYMLWRRVRRAAAPQHKLWPTRNR
jgi:hypothetical protein